VTAPNLHTIYLALQYDEGIDVYTKIIPVDPLSIQ